MRIAEVEDTQPAVEGLRAGRLVDRAHVSGAQRADLPRAERRPWPARARRAVVDRGLGGARAADSQTRAPARASLVSRRTHRLALPLRSPAPRLATHTAPRPCACCVRAGACVADRERAMEQDVATRTRCARAAHASIDLGAREHRPRRPLRRARADRSALRSHRLVTPPSYGTPPAQCRSPAARRRPRRGGRGAGCGRRWESRCTAASARGAARAPAAAARAALGQVQQRAEACCPAVCSYSAAQRGMRYRASLSAVCLAVVGGRQGPQLSRAWRAPR